MADQGFKVRADFWYEMPVRICKAITYCFAAPTCLHASFAHDEKFTEAFIAL